MPLVSIIMNVRNGARYLREALDSAVAQTFADWEMIAWDDRSTDDSANIIRQYNDPRIRYFLSPDETPLGKARDNAIRQATGEWLAFLDQDDIWLPDKLQKQMTLAGDGVGIIYGRAVLFDSRRGDLRDYDYAHEFELLPEGNIFSELFRNACFIAMSSAMLRCSAVAEIGGIPDTIQMVPDYYLYVAIAQPYQARAVQEVVCRYRLHAESMTASSEHRLRLHQEALYIVDRWADAGLEHSIANYRRMRVSTALASEELRNWRTTSTGLRRLLSDGSVLWLMSRPMVRMWRVLRRRFRQPYWRKYGTVNPCANQTQQLS
jgi:glycosyltransferase involved in cell wall biosynthesis